MTDDTSQLQFDESATSGTNASEADTLRLLRALAREAVAAQSSARPAEPQPSPPRVEQQPATLPEFLLLGPGRTGTQSQQEHLAGPAPSPATTSNAASTPLVESSRLSAEPEQPLRLPPWYARRLARLVGVAILPSLLVAAVASWLLSSHFARHDVPALQPDRKTNTLASTPQPADRPSLDRTAKSWQQTLVVLPREQALSDYQFVKNAMADCDAASERNPDTLYFLLIPIMPTQGIAELWAPKGNVHKSFILIPTNIVLPALQAASLALSSRQYKFSISDSASGNSYTWNPASAVSMVGLQDAGAITAFKLGFNITGDDTEEQWSREFPRSKSYCYWVAALSRA